MVESMNPEGGKEESGDIPTCVDYDFLSRNPKAVLYYTTVDDRLLAFFSIKQKSAAAGTCLA